MLLWGNYKDEGKWSSWTCFGYTHSHIERYIHTCICMYVCMYIHTYMSTLALSLATQIDSDIIYFLKSWINSFIFTNCFPNVALRSAASPSPGHLLFLELPTLESQSRVVNQKLLTWSPVIRFNSPYVWFCTCSSLTVPEDCWPNMAESTSPASDQRDTRPRCL